MTTTNPTNGGEPAMNEHTPQAPQHRRTHTTRNVLLICGGAAAVLLSASAIAGAAGGQPTARATHATIAVPAAPTAPAAPTYSSAPAPVKQVTRVRFIVTGHAAGGVAITYGSDADNRSPQGGLGFDGSGTAVPWRGSMRFRGDALYYSFDAQLQGGGDITCKIVVTGPDIDPLTVSVGHASGGYNICSAQAAPNDHLGSSWMNEG